MENQIIIIEQHTNSIYMPDDVRAYLISVDPALERLFTEVDRKGKLDFQALCKTTYVALIGAILGQIISYQEAKKLRSKLYLMVGTNFNISDIDTILTGPKTTEFPSKFINIITNVNRYLHENQITDQQINSLEFNIDSLLKIDGLGPWTVATTKLTAFRSWDLFPEGDKFIQKKIMKLYQLNKLPGKKDQKTISDRWSPYRTMVTWYLWRWFD